MINVRPISPGESSIATPTAVQVAVIGGGIGGLATAVALRHAGIDAHVFEKTMVLQEIGGAVVIRQPSIDLFDAWGLGAAFRREAVPLPDIELRDGSTGDVYGHTDLGMDGAGAAWSAHRADVHSALLTALPPMSVHLGKSAESIEDGGDGATATFSDGSDVFARLIVGADGIRSVTRRLISDDEPIFSHLVVLRGLVPADALPAEIPNDRIRMWGTVPHALATLPLRGGSLVALDTIIHADEAPEDLWASEVPTADLLDRFASFEPTVPALIAAGPDAVKAHPVFERQPLTTWSSGHVTLLGDAAHPMAPRMGQGANSAILDAGILANAIAHWGLDDLEAALAHYERVRIPAATAMQVGSRTAPPVVPVS